MPLKQLNYVDSHNSNSRITHSKYDISISTRYNYQICCPSNLQLHDNPDIYISAFSKHYYLLMCFLYRECSGELAGNYIWTVD